jgi:fructose-bisphosphate aldolase class 1
MPRGLYHKSDYNVALDHIAVELVVISSTLSTNKRLSQVENIHISHVSKTKPLFLRKFVWQVHDHLKSITRRKATLWSISGSYALSLNQAVQRTHKEKWFGGRKALEISILNLRRLPPRGLYRKLDFNGALDHIAVELVVISSTLSTNKRLSQVENIHISHVSKTKPLFLRKFVWQVHDHLKSITRRKATLWSISGSYALSLNQAVQRTHKEKWFGGRNINRRQTRQSFKF